MKTVILFRIREVLGKGRPDNPRAADSALMSSRLGIQEQASSSSHGRLQFDGPSRL